MKFYRKKTIEDYMGNKINCPHCNTEMELVDENLVCHKCGFMLSLEWIINTASVYIPKGTVTLPIYKEILGSDKKLEITLE